MAASSVPCGFQGNAALIVVGYDPSYRDLAMSTRWLLIISAIAALVILMAGGIWLALALG